MDAALPPTSLTLAAALLPYSALIPPTPCPPSRPALQQALRAGMAAMVLTNASPAMPIWGGRTPFLGTSPFAMAAPGPTPLLLDMATSVAAAAAGTHLPVLGKP